MYYDDDCTVCSWEMSLFKEKGEKLGIEFIDISDPKFKNKEKYETEMIGEFNG